MMYKHSCLSEVFPDIAPLSPLNMENVFRSLGRMKNRKPKKKKEKKIYSLFCKSGKRIVSVVLKIIVFHKQIGYNQYIGSSSVPQHQPDVLFPYSHSLTKHKCLNSRWGRALFVPDIAGCFGIPMSPRQLDTTAN